MSIIATPNLLITAAAATGEPLYDSGIHTSIYYEDFESYDTIAEFYSATGDYDYTFSGSGGSAGDREDILLTGGVDDGKNIRLDYTDSAAGGDYSMKYYPTGIDWATPTTGVDALIISYYVKNTGTYHGRKRHEHDMENAAGGERRFMLHTNRRTDPPTLEQCWWGAGWPFDPLDPVNTPPVNTGMNLDLNRVTPAESLQALTTNVNYADWAAWSDNDGNWHRYTIRITREGATAGTGRVEIWRDSVKITEYIGDDNSNYPCSYGLVLTVDDGAYAMMASAIIFGQTTSGGSTWGGGAYLYYDAVRVYVPN